MVFNSPSANDLAEFHHISHQNDIRVIYITISGLEHGLEFIKITPKTIIRAIRSF